MKIFIILLVGVIGVTSSSFAQYKETGLAAEGTLWSTILTVNEEHIAFYSSSIYFCDAGFGCLRCTKSYYNPGATLFTKFECDDYSEWGYIFPLFGIGLKFNTFIDRARIGMALIIKVDDNYIPEPWIFD